MTKFASLLLAAAATTALMTAPSFAQQGANQDQTDPSQHHRRGDNPNGAPNGNTTQPGNTGQTNQGPPTGAGNGQNAGPPRGGNTGAQGAGNPGDHQNNGPQTNGPPRGNDDNRNGDNGRESGDDHRGPPNGGNNDQRGDDNRNGDHGRDRGDDHRGPPGGDRNGPGFNDRHDDHRFDDRRGFNDRWDPSQHNGYMWNGRWNYGQPPASYYGRPGFSMGYHAWRRGDRLPRYFRDRYERVDYRAYHLRRPPRGHYYVRDDRGDILLVALTTGIILSVLLNDR